MSDPDFNAAAEIEELIKSQLMAFAAWCEKNWQLDKRDQIEMGRSEEYVSGYNAGVAGITGAVEAYTGDMWL